MQGGLDDAASTKRENEEETPKSLTQTPARFPPFAFLSFFFVSYHCGDASELCVCVYIGMICCCRFPLLTVADRSPIRNRSLSFISPCITKPPSYHQ